MPSHDAVIGASGPGESGVCARPVGQTENAPPTISARQPTDCHLRKLATKAFGLECIGIGKSFGTVWSAAASVHPSQCYGGQEARRRFGSTRDAHTASKAALRFACPAPYTHF